MKRILALFLACTLILSGCTSTGKQTQSSQDTGANSAPTVTQTTSVADTPVPSETSEPPQNVSSSETPQPTEAIPESSFSPQQTETDLSFMGLNDPKLLQYVEDTVYSELAGTFASEDYIIENVHAIYISKEYLEEVAYNSQANIFFGYTLAELDEQFQGTRYVFTLDENGETTVVPFEDYDDTYDKVIRNVAIGTGVILLCVTVSVATGGAGLVPVSMVFAASAKTATIMALSSGAIGGVSARTLTQH